VSVALTLQIQDNVARFLSVFYDFFRVRALILMFLSGAGMKLDLCFAGALAIGIN